MPCPEIDPATLPDYAVIEVNTFVEFRNGSLDFISLYPSVFMRGADYVVIDHTMGRISAFWRPGTFASASKAVHCSGGYLTAYFACEGNQPRVTLIGVIGKKYFSSRWILPFGYPGLTRLGEFCLESDCDEYFDTVSTGHLARYINLLTGNSDVSECAPLAISETGVKTGFLKYLLEFDHLNDEQAHFSCGLCPGDSDVVDHSDSGFKAFSNYVSARSKSKVYTLGLVAAKTLIAVGEVLISNKMPSSVAIPFGCNVWEFYNTNPLKSTDLIIPQLNCHGEYRILASKGGVCFSVKDPEDSPPPPPRLPDDGDDGGLGTGSSFGWPVSDPQPDPGARSIGPSWFIPPDVPDPVKCLEPHCRVFRWTFKYADASKDHEWWMQSYSAEAKWGGWIKHPDPNSKTKWYSILNEPICKDGVITGYVQHFTESPGFVREHDYAPIEPVAPTPITEVKDPPAQYRCACSQWKITYYFVVKFAFLSGFRTMATTIVPSCPSGSAPTISPDGYIMCDGAVTGAVGFALSTFLFYRVDVLKVECIS